jgi:cytidylate kinase
MAASVVTFSVQVGAPGTAIARQVAEALSYRYYDWEVTSQAAALAGVSPEVIVASERVPGFLERVLNRLLSASALSADETQAIFGPNPAVVTAALQSLSSEDYRSFIERVLAGLADRGEAVIVGHAGQAALAGRPGVLRVLVHGSAERRAERLAAEREMSPEEALKAIIQSDMDRAKFFKRAYKLDWLGAAAYDLTLNSDNIPTETARDIVLAAARSIA